MLVVFAGLPGTGKTSLARALAQAWPATYLRIDTIEQALRSGGNADVGPAGYLVAYRLAGDNLRLGRNVVADCVNPLAVTRDAWRDVAEAAARAILEVEVICSDLDEHRRRVETRVGDIAGLKLPTWREITASDYQSWDRRRLVLDTATLTPTTALAKLQAEIAAGFARPSD